MLVIVWVYYAAQIFLFGAELAHVYAMRHGTRSTAGAQAAERSRGRAERDARPAPSA